MVQICMCGAQAGFRHFADCPYPMFTASTAQEARWYEARMKRAVELAVRILARDGVAPLEGKAFTQGERELLENVAGLTVAELRS